VTVFHAQTTHSLPAKPGAGTSDILHMERGTATAIVGPQPLHDPKLVVSIMLRCLKYSHDLLGGNIFLDIVLHREYVPAARLEDSVP